MLQLCFEVCADTLSYSILDAKTKSLVRSKSVAIHHRAEELKVEIASNFLREEQLLDFDGEVSLSFASEKATLLPQSVYGDTNSKDVFKLAFGETDKTVEHNRFFEQGLVVVYEIESWIKRFFVIRYPRIIIQSFATHLLRGIFDQPTFETKLHIGLYDSFFFAAVVGKNKILGFNSFTYENHADIAFYSLHLLKSCEIAPRQINLVWHTGENQETKLKESEAIFKASMEGESLDSAVINRVKHQLLCV